MLHCDDHDYLEIACTFRLPVRLVLQGGESLEGVPATRRNVRSVCCWIWAVRAGR